MPVENVINPGRETPSTSRRSRELIQIPLDNETENEPEVSGLMHPQGKPTACLESHQNVKSRTETRSGRFSIPAKSSVWRRGWKTLLPIVGFYALAWICAIVHCFLFYYLNGRVINQEHESLSFKSTPLPQTWATTISLVLVTAFRAALIACVGPCYAQYLWKELRSQLLEVGLIEELFRIRSNPLRLLNPKLVQNTPILFLIAVFSWLVPVATIYPPGALIVHLDFRNVSAEFNVSVFKPNNTYSFTGLELDGGITNGFAIVDVPMPIGGSGQVFCNATSNCLYLSRISTPISNLATSVLMSKSITSMDSPRGANASYTLNFRGPVMQCTQTVIMNQTMLHDQTVETSNAQLELGISDLTMRWEFQEFSLNATTSGNESWSYFPCHDFSRVTQQQNSSVVNITILQRVESLECLPGTAEYTVTIDYINNQQSVHYSVKDKQPLAKRSNHFYTSKGFDFSPFDSFEEYVNVLALITSSLIHLGYNGQITLGAELQSTPEILRLPNGTTAEVCSVVRNWFNTFPENEILRDSNFNPRIVNEAFLDSLLANITISALSLNNWYGLVNGTEPRPFNAYRFENKLNFFLPYGLSLLLAIPFIGIGLLAIRDNGVTAIDGGFLQILMTTTGRTKLEAAAIQGCVGGEENIPSGLKKLKVRFGELIVDENTLVGENVADMEAKTVDNAPRGTLDESIPLEQLGLGRQEARSVISNSELRERNRPERRAGSDGMGEYAEVASGVDECSTESHVMRRLAFGTIDEIKPMKKGVRYG